LRLWDHFGDLGDRLLILFIDLANSFYWFRFFGVDLDPFCVFFVDFDGAGVGGGFGGGLEHCPKMVLFDNY